MAALLIATERRQRPREGVMGQLDDIAYAVLRTYGIGKVNTEHEIPPRNEEASISL